MSNIVGPTILFIIVSTILLSIVSTILFNIVSTVLFNIFSTILFSIVSTMSNTPTQASPATPPTQATPPTGNTSSTGNNSNRSPFDPKFDTQSKCFDKAHIDGTHSPGKERNQMAEFQDPNVNYTPLRESGQKGTRAQGTRPGQIKVVTSPLPYTETGMNKPVSQNNKASFILGMQQLRGS